MHNVYSSVIQPMQRPLPPPHDSHVATPDARWLGGAPPEDDPSNSSGARCSSPTCRRRSARSSGVRAPIWVSGHVDRIGSGEPASDIAQPGRAATLGRAATSRSWRQRCTSKEMEVDKFAHTLSTWAVCQEGCDSVPVLPTSEARRNYLCRMSSEICYMSPRSGTTNSFLLRACPPQGRQIPHAGVVVPLRCLNR